MDLEAPQEKPEITSAHSQRDRLSPRSPYQPNAVSQYPLSSVERPASSTSFLNTSSASIPRTEQRSSSTSSLPYRFHLNNDRNPLDPRPNGSPIPSSHSFFRTSSGSLPSKTHYSVDSIAKAVASFNVNGEIGATTPERPHSAFEVNCNFPNPEVIDAFLSSSIGKLPREQVASTWNDSQPYDSSREPKPNHDYFSERFQQVLKDGKLLASNVKSVLSHYTALDRAQISRLQDCAADYAQSGTGATRAIGILGDSGSGKSRLINSLLDCEIAKTSNSGEAVTSVIMEFRWLAEPSTAPFKVEMHFCNQSESDELIKELVRSYRGIHLLQLDGDEISASECEEVERRHEVAWSALSAAFGHHRQLKSLCDKKTENANDEVVAQLSTWFADLQWPSGSQNGRWESPFESANDCLNMTSNLMEDRFWPFIKIIRVYLKAPILETGLVLVDMPGLRDVNLAKVKATEEHLFKTDHIFIVSPIGRAVSSRSVKESLITVFGASKQHVPVSSDEHEARHPRVTIVCTHSEISNDMTAEELKRKYVLNRMVDASSVDKLEKQHDMAKRNENQLEQHRVKQELKHILMKARSDDVTTKIESKYAGQTHGQLIEVFCVANSEYFDCSRKGDITGVNASGIPALRRRCYMVSADASLLEARNYLLSTLPSLLESTKLWIQSLSGQCRKSSGEREKAKENVEQLTTLTRASIGGLELASKESFSENISNLIEFGTKRKGNGTTIGLKPSGWESAALEKSMEWERWPHSSYSAWCRHDGTHCTIVRGPVRWNMELIWKMRCEIEVQWDLFEDDIKDGIRDVVKSAKTALTDLANKFKANENFARAIELQMRNAEHKLGRVEYSALKQTQLLLRKIVEDGSTSFVLKAMRPAYQEASQMSGRGSDQRRKARIKSQIENDLFVHITNDIVVASDLLIEDNCRYVEAVLVELLHAVRTDFDVAYGTSGKEEPSLPATEDLRAKQAASELEPIWERWQQHAANIKAALTG